MVNKKKKVLNKTARISYLIFLLASIIFIFLLNKILPGKFTILLIGLFSFLFVIFGFFALFVKVKKKYKIIQIVSCLLLAIGLILCDVAIPIYSGKLARLFVKIPNEGQMNINVYILNDRNYSDIEDLAGKTVGIQSKVDIDYQNYASIIADNKDFADFNDKCKNLYTVVQKVQLLDSTTSVTDIVNEPFLIAVSGNDQWDYNSINSNSSFRTDVNMLVGINPKTKQALIITLPRDSYVYLDGMGYDKLTHASIYGNNCWVNAIKNILSLDEINYYFKVNFQSVSAIVDALGGVQVDNPYYFESSYCLRYDESLNKWTILKTRR